MYIHSWAEFLLLVGYLVPGNFLPFHNNTSNCLPPLFSPYPYQLPPVAPTSFRPFFSLSSLGIRVSLSYISVVAVGFHYLALQSKTYSQVHISPTHTHTLTHMTEASGCATHTHIYSCFFPSLRCIFN